MHRMIKDPGEHYTLQEVEEVLRTESSRERVAGMPRPVACSTSVLVSMTGHIGGDPVLRNRWEAYLCLKTKWSLGCSPVGRADVAAGYVGAGRRNSLLNSRVPAPPCGVRPVPAYTLGRMLATLSSWQGLPPSSPVSSVSTH